MDGVMSQEEINALLNGSEDSSEQPKEEVLTEKEKDTIGEIANISMGTAATTLFSLVNRKVEISTPVVSFANWSDICEAMCVYPDRIYCRTGWQQHIGFKGTRCKSNH